MSAALAQDQRRLSLHLPAEVVANILQLAIEAKEDDYTYSGNADMGGGAVWFKRRKSVLRVASLVDRTWRPQAQRLLFVEPLLASRADIQSWVLGQRRGMYRPVLLEMYAARKDSEQPFARWDSTAWKEEDAREVLDMCGSSLRTFGLEWRHSMKLDILEHEALDGISALCVIWMDAPFSPLFEPTLEDIRLERLAPRYPLHRPLPLTTLSITSSDPDQPCNLLLSALSTSLSSLIELDLRLEGDSVDTTALVAFIVAAAPTLQRLSISLSDRTYEVVYPSLCLSNSLAFFSQCLGASSELGEFFNALPPGVKSVILDGHDWETVLNGVCIFCVGLVEDAKCAGLETIRTADKILLEVDRMFDEGEDILVKLWEERGISFVDLQGVRKRPELALDRDASE